AIVLYNDNMGESCVVEHYSHFVTAVARFEWRREPVELVVDAHLERVIRIRLQRQGGSDALQAPNTAREPVRKHEYPIDRGRNRVTEDPQKGLWDPRRYSPCGSDKAEKKPVPPARRDPVDVDVDVAAGADESCEGLQGARRVRKMVQDTDCH